MKHSIVGKLTQYYIYIKFSNMYAIWIELTNIIIWATAKSNTNVWIPYQCPLHIIEHSENGRYATMKRKNSEYCIANVTGMEYLIVKRFAT